MLIADYVRGYLRPTTGLRRKAHVSEVFLIREAVFSVINIYSIIFEDKMSATLWFLLLCVLNMCFAADLPVAEPTYITRYDYLDIDKILSNDRILRRLMDCLMDRGLCTREGKELKRKDSSLFFTYLLVTSG